jgi:hypothetical protein
MALLQFPVAATRALVQVNLEICYPSTWLAKTDQPFFQRRKVSKLFRVMM